MWTEIKWEFLNQFSLPRVDFLGVPGELLAHAMRQLVMSLCPVSVFTVCAVHTSGELFSLFEMRLEVILLEPELTCACSTRTLSSLSLFCETHSVCTRHRYAIAESKTNAEGLEES